MQTFKIIKLGNSSKADPFLDYIATPCQLYQILRDQNMNMQIESKRWYIYIASSNSGGDGAFVAM